MVGTSRTSIENSLKMIELVRRVNDVTYKEGIRENRRCSVSVSCSASWLEDSLSKLNSASNGV